MLLSFLVAYVVFGLCLATDNQVDHSELQESVVQELMKCINALPTDYRLYVNSDGFVVVIPAGRRTIDLYGVDKGLLNCMQLVLGEMTVAAESSEFEDPSHQSAISTGSVDYAYLLENGAKGQRIPYGSSESGNAVARSDKSTNILRKRCASYYGIYTDAYAGCLNADFNQYYFGGCISKPSYYASTKFYNPDACNGMLATTWPHHNCGGGNQYSILVSSGTTSACRTSTVYSWLSNPVTR